MKFISDKFLLFALLLQSCMTSHNNVSKWTNRPQWISETLKYCGAEKICAVGYGKNSSEAESSGRNNLAKIFQTRIKSDSSIQTFSQSSSSVEGPRGNTQEEYFELVQESTEFVLKGAKVEKRFRDDNDSSSYALISLEKSMGSRFLRQKIAGLDEEIKALYKTGRRGRIAKALKLYKARDALEEYYLVIRFAPISPLVSRKQLLDKQFALSGLRHTILMEFDNTIDRNFQDFLIREFLDLNYKVVTDEKKSFDFIVQANIHTKKVYLNVEGFQKLQFFLTITSFKKRGEKLGQFFSKFEETGRSKEDILRKVAEKMMSTVADKINELNLD